MYYVAIGMRISMMRVCVQSEHQAKVSCIDCYMHTYVHHIHVHALMIAKS